MAASLTTSQGREAIRLQLQPSGVKSIGALKEDLKKIAKILGAHQKAILNVLGNLGPNEKCYIKTGADWIIPVQIGENGEICVSTAIPVDALTYIILEATHQGGEVVSSAFSIRNGQLTEKMRVHVDPDCFTLHLRGLDGSNDRIIKLATGSPNQITTWQTTKLGEEPENATLTSLAMGFPEDSLAKATDEVAKAINTLFELTNNLISITKEQSAGPDDNSWAHNLTVKIVNT